MDERFVPQATRRAPVSVFTPSMQALFRAVSEVSSPARRSCVVDAALDRSSLDNSLAANSAFRHGVRSRPQCASVRGESAMQSVAVCFALAWGCGAAGHDLEPESPRGYSVSSTGAPPGWH